jgi:hypothetical protein
VDRQYEIFECLDDGSVLWSARATGLEDTRARLDDLLQGTGKEYFAIHLSTRDIIFARDSSMVISNHTAQRIFHIGYDEKLRRLRAEFLRSLGYAVISVLGNEAAKGLLGILHKDPLRITLFIIGHAAPAQTRREMADWLKSNYPNAKILALNPPTEHVADADFNVEESGPETWLPIVASTISSLQAG